MKERKLFKVTGLWERKTKAGRTLLTAKFSVSQLASILKSMREQGIEEFDFAVWQNEGKLSPTSPDYSVVFSELFKPQ